MVIDSVNHHSGSAVKIGICKGLGRLRNVRFFEFRSVFRLGPRSMFEGGYRMVRLG